MHCTPSAHSPVIPSTVEAPAATAAATTASAAPRSAVPSVEVKPAAPSATLPAPAHADRPVQTEPVTMLSPAVSSDAAPDAVEIGELSHEVRTALNIVLGMTWVLRRTAPDPHQLDCIAKIEAAGRHLLDVVEDLTD